MSIWDIFIFINYITNFLKSWHEASLTTRLYRIKRNNRFNILEYTKNFNLIIEENSSYIYFVAIFFFILLQLLVCLSIDINNFIGTIPH